MACRTSNKIDRISDGHRDAEVERYTSVLTVGARNLFKSVWNIRLSTHIKFHVRIHREAVAAF